MTGPRVTADDLAGLRERARIADEAGCLPAIAGRHWLALLDDLAAAQTQLAQLREAISEYGMFGSFIGHAWLRDYDRAALAEGPAPETTPNGPRRADVRVESQPSEEAK